MAINFLNNIASIGALTITRATTDPLLYLYNTTNGGGATIRFSDQTTPTQIGDITYFHSDGSSQGGGASFHFRSEPDTTVVAGGPSNTGRFVSKSKNDVTEVDYGFYDDVNTGMYRIGSDNLGFATGGVNRLNITNALATFSGDLTVNGGDIILGGTGRIQGIDTVSANTDAANKLYVDNAIAGVPQGDITAVVAGSYLTGGGTSGSVTLNGDNTKLAHIADSSNGSVNSGWITVAQAANSRKAGEIYVTDGESSDHSYIRIEWMRSYADSNFTVINCGGHANRIQGVRVLEQTSDVTYGPKYLQVKVTTTSNYYVIVTAPGTIPHYGDLIAETPVLENTKTGYQLTGAQLEDLQNSSVGTDEGITVGGDLFVNGGDIVLGGTGRIQGVDTVSAGTDAANKAYVDAHVTPAGTYLPLAGGVMTGKIKRSSAIVGFLEGSYNNVGANNTNTNPIYTIGSNYNPASTTLSNMYGVGYTRGDAGFLTFTSSSGWGLYVAAVGVAKIFLDGEYGHISTTGNVYASGGNSTEWNTAYDNSVTALAFSGASTTTLTLTQQDGGVVLNTFSNPQGTVTGVTSGNVNTITVSTGSPTPLVTAITGAVSSGSTNLATGAQIQTAINTALLGLLSYQSTWNASTNSPALASGVGTPGYYYIVSVAGSTNLDGITDWAVGDWAVFSDLATDAWQKIDNTQVGNVTGDGTAGRIAYWNSNTNITNDGDLLFDGANLTVGGSVNIADDITLTNAGGVIQMNGAGYIGAQDNFYVGGATNGTDHTYIGDSARNVTIYNGATLTVSGNLNLSSVANATIDTDKFLVSDSGTVKYRTGAQVLSDIGGAPATGGSYLPLSAGISYPLTGDLWLDDNSGASPSLYLQNGSNNYWRLINGSTGIFSLKEGTSDRITILPGGNVGIGTTSPTDLFTVISTGTASFGNKKYATYTGTDSGAGSGNGFIASLNDQQGTTLTANHQYKFYITTTGTGTYNSSVYIVYRNSANTAWVERAVSVGGSTSNHPLLDISGNNAIIYDGHSSTYTVRYRVETTNSNQALTSPNIFGVDSMWQNSAGTLLYPDGSVGINATGTGGKLEVGGNIKVNAGNGEGFFVNSTVGTSGFVRKDGTGVSIITNSADRLIINNAGLATFSSTPVVLTRSAGDNTTRAASTAFVTTAVAAVPIGNYLPLAGGTMTGDIVMQDELLNFKSGGSSSLPQFTGLRNGTDLNYRSWTTEGGWAYTTFDNGTSNQPSAGLHNANGLLSFNTHSGDYMAQIAMTTNTGKLWHRRRNGGGWLTWYQIYSTQDFSTTDISNWNTAYDNSVTAISDSGTSTTTITLTQQDGGTLSTSFSNPQGTGNVTTGGFTNGRVPFANSSVNLDNSANLTFDGSALTIGQPTHGLGILNTLGQIYIEHQGTAWNETTPGTTRGAIHMDPVGSGANDTGNAITFGASDHSAGTVSDAGIYVRSDGNYGTKMYIATTDSYSVGSKTAITIQQTGAVAINRSHLTISTITNSSSDTDKFLVSNSGQVQYRTGAQVLSDIGGAPATGGSYLPIANPTFTGTLSGPAATITTVTGALVGNVTGNVSGSSGSTTGNAATVTNGVYTIGNQTIAGTKTFSSTIAGSISGNAVTAGGLAINTSGTNNVANQIVRTEANGYVNFGWINSASGATTSTITRITASNDAYLRYVTPATFRSQVIAPYFAPIGTVSGVTSVNFKTDGTALNVVSNTITGSGTLTGVWQGTSSQYVGGDGDLKSFPTIPQGDITQVNITAGNGLSGTSVDTTSGAHVQTLTVGQGDGISISSTAVAVNSTVVRTTGTQSIAGAKTFTTTPISVTRSTADNSTYLATTAFVKNQGYVTGSYLPLAGGIMNANAAITMSGNLTTSANVYAQRWYDQGNNAFYGDFAGTSQFNHVKVNSVLGTRNFVSGSYGWQLEQSTTTANPVTFRFDNQKYRVYAGGGAGEIMTFLEGGNIGIGNTSPGSKLVVSSPLISNGFNADFQINGGNNYGMTNLNVEIPGYGTGIKINSPTSSSVDNQAMTFYQQTTKVGSIMINTSSTSYNTTSDYRLKENREDISDAIERVKELKPIKFNWIKEPGESKVDGFYAHELAEVVPEAVTGEKDALDWEGNPEYQSIDQAKIVPLLTAALQQAIDKIEALEVRIQTLENK